MEEEIDLERARDLILAFGWNTTCYQILNPGFSLWFSARGDAVVGYVQYRTTRVVGGGPICADERLAEVVEEFECDASHEGFRVCYFAAESRLEEICRDDSYYSTMLIGSLPVWDPHAWPQMLSQHSSLRAQLNRARNKDVIISEWSADRAQGNPKLQQCLGEWLDTRGLPPLHFLIETDTLSRPLDRRIFVAKRSGVVIAFLVAAPIPQREGWLVEQLIRGHSAVNGTSELLVGTCTDAVARSGSTFITLGLAPLSRRAAYSEDTNPLWLRMTLGWMRAHANRFYSFRGLEAFKAKFRPSRWQPAFAIVNESRITPGLLYAIAGAFASGPPGILIARALAHAAGSEISRLKRRMWCVPGSR